MEETSKKKLKKFAPPDAYIVLFIILVAVFIFSYFIPVGSFQVQQEIYVYKGVEKTRNLVNPESFTYLVDEQGNAQTSPRKLFTDYYVTEDTGLLNAPFDGFNTGGKGGMTGIICFVLMIGASFNVVLRTGTFDCLIDFIIRKLEDKEILLIPILQLVLSLLGSCLGLTEEFIPLAMFMIPMFVKLGYDSLTGLLVMYLAPFLGSVLTWMNPFTLVVAQGIADIPILSGAWYRVILYVIFMVPFIAYTMIRAKKIKANPQLSPVWELDNLHFRQGEMHLEKQEHPFKLGHGIILAAFAALLGWMFWGITAKGWFIAQLSAQFFALGVFSGIIGVLFKLNDMKWNDIADAFKSGVSDLAPVVMICAFAQGILLLMGGTDNSTPNMINTILYHGGNMLSHLPPVLSAWGMLVFETILNFLINSGSAMAAISMPILAPLSDMAGVSRQIACLALQLGDGFTSVICPISATLMAFLGIAKLDFVTWVKWQVKMQLIFFAFASAAIMIAHVIGYR